MDIKFAEQSRVARYGIALGALLYAVWCGLVRVFVPAISDQGARVAGVGRCQSAGRA